MSGHVLAVSFACQKSHNYSSAILYVIETNQANSHRAAVESLTLEYSESELYLEENVRYDPIVALAYPQGTKQISVVDNRK